MTVHTTSRIPAAIDALVSASRAALAGVSVVDGPPLSWDDIGSATAGGDVSLRDWLFIGARPDDFNAADGEQDFNAAGAVSRDEQFTVYCTSYSCDGGMDVKVVRDSSFALVAQVEEIIRTDPTLGDAVLYSRMSGVTGAEQRQYEDGCDATVTFGVACRAYLE